MQLASIQYDNPNKPLSWSWSVKPSQSVFCENGVKPERCIRPNFAILPWPKTCLSRTVVKQTPEVSLSGKHILLVDDERAMRLMVRQVLTDDNHTVVEANNGAEALGLFAQEQFDLVVTDCRMPFVHGNELAARIRQLAPNQPILMITGYGNWPGRDNPVNVVLQKPFGMSQLRSVVAKLLVPEPDTETVELAR
jgi:CheY-like chemotaxis protein